MAECITNERMNMHCVDGEAVSVSVSFLCVFRCFLLLLQFCQHDNIKSLFTYLEFRPYR